VGKALSLGCHEARFGGAGGGQHPMDQGSRAVAVRVSITREKLARTSSYCCLNRAGLNKQSEEGKAFSCLSRSHYKEVVMGLVKERAGLELKVQVVPKDGALERWLCGRWILEQPCLGGEDCWAFPFDHWWESMGLRGSQSPSQRSGLLCPCLQVRAEARRPAADVSPGPLVVCLPSESPSNPTA